MLQLHDLYIKPGLIRDEALFAKLIQTKRILIVTDPCISKLYLPTLLNTLQNYQVDVLVLDIDEQQKNLSTVEKILGVLVAKQFDRSCMIISFSGGVIGDLTGLAAALYMRGMQWLQIPTTLMAQVDAAIGGKTGCNFQGQKNLIGAFYFPQAIVMDLDLLSTLPAREFNSGLAEVVKYGFAFDADFFIWLEQNLLAIRRLDPLVMQRLVERCCAIKQLIVQADPNEQKQRMILNFGHTFGHALEAATGFKTYRHGEAVALGMLLASRLAVKIGLIDNAILHRLVSLLTGLGLDLSLPQTLSDYSVLRNYMVNDKKKRSGILQLILPCALGNVLIVPEDQIKEAEQI